MTTSLLLPLTDEPIDWPADRIACWGDEKWWQAEIDGAIADPDPSGVNARITLLHRELALALARVVGPDAGPTYHAWAVWASLKAGRVIRREEGSWILGAAPTAALAAGSFVGLPGIGSVCAGLVGAVAAVAVTARGLSRASAAVLAGNVAVIDDLGRHSARFACTFADEQNRTEHALEEFLRPLSPEPSSQGGQSLLRDAYRQYFMAAMESDPARRDQRMLLGNLSALLHEHWGLQRFFTAAIPRPLRHAVTAHGLKFRVGEECLSVGRDMVAPAGCDPYPATLATIELPELRTFLAQWDRNPDTLAGSGASDWCEIGDRLNYIVDLFRSRHHDPNVLRAPFAAAEQARIISRGTGCSAA